MSQYFRNSYERSSGNIKVELGLFNYATKADLTRTRGVDISNLTVKSDLVSLKAKVKKIDIGKKNCSCWFK